jgi:Zn-dependent peptidase ImmA (M78 family)
MILHPNKTKNRVDIYNYSEPESIDETEANFFAASLLMPKDKFISLWELTRDIGIVSEFFGVSQLAAKNRLSWIGTNTRA